MKTPDSPYSIKSALRTIRLPVQSRNTNSISASAVEPRFGSGRVFRSLFPTIYRLLAGNNRFPALLATTSISPKHPISLCATLSEALTGGRNERKLKD